MIHAHDRRLSAGALVVLLFAHNMVAVLPNELWLAILSHIDAPTLRLVASVRHAKITA